MSAAPKGDCVWWSGYINPTTGYGYAYNPLTKLMASAHRVAWEREYGPIPEGHEPDHVCLNRACVNLDHIRILTVTKNRRLGRAKLTDEQVRYIRESPKTGTVLAKELGVHHSTVYSARRGKHYKEVV